MVLGPIPVVAGSLRLVELAGGARADARRRPLTPHPVPVVVHVVGAAVFAILGAFQFSARSVVATRAGTAGPGGSWWWPGWGWRCSALWLNQFYPARPGRELLCALRLAFGAAMAAPSSSGSPRSAAATSRPPGLDDASYAIGLVAGTQVFTLGIGGVCSAPAT